MSSMTIGCRHGEQPLLIVPSAGGFPFFVSSRRCGSRGPQAPAQEVTHAAGTLSALAEMAATAWRALRAARSWSAR